MLSNCFPCQLLVKHLNRSDLPSRLAELLKRLEGVRAVLEGVQDLLGLPGQPLWHRQVQEAILGSLSRDLLHMELHSRQAAGKQRTVAPSPPTFLGRQDILLALEEC